MTKAKKCGGSKTAPLDDIPEWELGAWARLRHDSVETASRSARKVGSRRHKSTNRRRPQIELPLGCRCGGTAFPYMYEDGKTSCKCLGLPASSGNLSSPPPLPDYQPRRARCVVIFLVSPLPRPPVSLAIMVGNDDDDDERGHATADDAGHGLLNRLLAASCTASTTSL